MSKKEKFIELVNVLMENVSVDKTEWNDALEYFEAFKVIEEKEKPLFTEKGKEILKYLQENYKTYNNAFSSKQVGEGMGIPTKSISGSMRSLLNGSFIEKISDKPVVYSLTENGKNIVIESEE